MSLDEMKYVAILAGSIPVGFIMKQMGSMSREVGSTLVGFSIVAATCGIHTFHSMLTILVTWAIVRFCTRHCQNLTFIWTFTYLLFFRMLGLCNLPVPTPFANAVQLILTLKMVSLAAELNKLYLDSIKKEGAGTGSPGKRFMTDVMPQLKEVVCYGYCYLGIMTGPFYRYKTYQDWLFETRMWRVPTWKPLLSRLHLGPLYGVAFILVSRVCPLEYVKTEEFGQQSFVYHLFYTAVIFFVFRMRFYVAWTFAECACITAGLGAYPVAAQSTSGNGPTHEYFTSSNEPQEYDYETIKNIDPHNTDFCTSVKDGMKYWNMTVQWWLAHYVYRNAPVKPRLLRIGWTMLVSAYWHGIHPGYYLSFLTIPLCLAAEGAMDVGLRERLGPRSRRAYDWVHWFWKMRAYDYMCMGFVLLTFRDTLAYWLGLYFYLHLLALGFFVLGCALAARRDRDVTSGLLAPPRPKRPPSPPPLPPLPRAPFRLPPLAREPQEKVSPAAAQLAGPARRRKSSAASVAGEAEEAPPPTADLPPHRGPPPPPAPPLPPQRPLGPAPPHRPSRRTLDEFMKGARR